MLEKGDHRRIGQELDLFAMHEEAPGMVFWHSRGWLLYRALEEAVRRHMRQQGFHEVRSPQLLRQALWEASGHWHVFADGMFKLGDERAAALKPVSCPAHLLMAKAMNLSYRDLPYRMGELGLVHRAEQSGALHGLFRLRQFVQDDGHILCAPEHIIDEVARFCASLHAFYAAFGFDDLSVAFAGRPEQRLGSDEVWDRAEAILLDAADQIGLSLAPHPGEGAFYGPKLEFVLHDRLGRPWQCGTIQLDLVLAERFGVEYVAADGARKRPAVLHRAVLGSLERFLGIVLEHVNGVLPAWLAPEQVVIAPIAARHHAAADELRSRLPGLRVAIDARNESLARRVSEAHHRAVPFVAVLGDREIASNEVALRCRGEQQVVPVDEAVRLLAIRCQPPL
jgi:threonyl-tRNA synthetase